ncbi:MAG: septum formation initiator family protein [Atopobiaceae bacterium]|nr:septum formation initiator family protein [Atopobiaceae bacterium]
MDSRGNNNQFRSVALIQRRDLTRFSSTVPAELRDDAVPPTERRRAPLRDAIPVEREEALRPREHVSAYLGESSVVSVSRRSERGLATGRDENEMPREGRLERRSRREERAPKRRSRFKLVMGKARERYDDYDDEYAEYDDYTDYEDDFDDYEDEYDDYETYDDDWSDDDSDLDDEPYESEIDLTIHHRRRRNRFDDAPQDDPDRNPYIYDYNGRRRGLADPQGRRSRSHATNGGIRAIPQAIGSAVVGIANHIPRGGVMFILVVAITVVMLFAPLRDLYVANRRLDTLQATYDALLAENDSIRSELESLQSREGIENEARARGYVEPGETKVVVNGLPEDESDPAADAVHDIELPDDRPWYIRTLDAVFGYEPEV